MEPTCRDRLETELRESILQPLASPALWSPVDSPRSSSSSRNQKTREPIDAVHTDQPLGAQTWVARGWRVDLEGQRFHHPFSQPVSSDNLMVGKDESEFLFNLWLQLSHELGFILMGIHIGQLSMKPSDTITWLKLVRCHLKHRRDAPEFKTQDK